MQVLLFSSKRPTQKALFCLARSLWEVWIAPSPKHWVSSWAGQKCLSTPTFKPNVGRMGGVPLGLVQTWPVCCSAGCKDLCVKGAGA